MHGDNAATWVVGSPLPADEFLTRWITHLCAPVFVLLAGTSLALSSEKRRGQPGQTAFLVKRGLLIAALDPLWMSLGFAKYHVMVLQVLYAIGLSMVAMAWLRKLPTWALVITGLAIAFLGELSMKAVPAGEPWRALWQLLWTGGPLVQGVAVCAYPLVPWLSMMIAGWLLGRWILVDPSRPAPSRAPMLLALGGLLLCLFAIVRGIDGYGNWGLHRDLVGVLQWLHVAKYPPSLSYTALELGIGFVLLAVFFALDDGRERRWLAPLALFGSTAFFYYLLHVHLLLLADTVLRFDPDRYGLAKTYVGAAAVLVALYPLCVRYRRYKAAHPDGWARYI
jgi:uncharacterized membrane protein